MSVHVYCLLTNLMIMIVSLLYLLSLLTELSPRDYVLLGLLANSFPIDLKLSNTRNQCNC